VGARRERAERKSIPSAGSCRAGPHHEDVGLLLAHRDDGGVQPKLDLRVDVRGFFGGSGLAPRLSHGGF
jgi:hypothetical protein